MPRIARVVAVGLPHHVTQRGNYRQKVFLNDEDRCQYLAWIQEYSEKYGLSILAYCLMLTHVHFIAMPEESYSLSKTFNTAHMRYSQYINNKSNQHGHLWQGRFYSCVLDEPHLILAARYVERNPVRAGLAKKPWEWKWSSAAAHIGQSCDTPIKLGDLLGIIGMSCHKWKEYIASPEDVNSAQDIRKYTSTGRPLGRSAFIEILEESCNRKLRAPTLGRPKK